MNTHPKSDPGTADRQGSFWSEFRDLCALIEGLSPIPFRILDAGDEIIYQSRRPPDEHAETTLTMHCRSGHRVFFRILCQTDERARKEVLDLMFALKKIGLFYKTGRENRESIYEEIARNYRFLHFFYTLPALLSRDVHRNRLCQVGLDRICKILNVERGSIFLYNAASQSFRLVAVYGKTFFRPAAATMNSKILDAIQEKSRSLLVEDVTRFPDFKGKGDYRTPSFLSAPIYFHPSIQEKRLAGVVNLADPVGRPAFTSHDLKFVSSAAAYTVFLAMTKPERKVDA